MTDLDQRIREDLERLTSLAPLPPSTGEITSRTRVAEHRRRPVLVGLAAAAIVIAAVAGAIVLRQRAGDGDGDGEGDGVAQPVPAAVDPDVTVFMNQNATQAQVDAIGAQLQQAPEVVSVTYVDQAQAHLELERLYGADPNGMGAVSPEAVSTMFRLTLADPVVGGPQALMSQLAQSPGVLDVVRRDGRPMDPGEAVPSEVVLPRLDVDLPGWGAPTVVDDRWAGPPEESGPQMVVYQGAGGWLPLIAVLTTDAGYGLGTGTRTIEVAGHQAQLSPRMHTTQVIGWEEGGETLAITGYGVDEDDLIAAAQTLVRAADGGYELSGAPMGMAEVYRSDGPNYSAHRARTVSIQRDDGADDLEISEETNGPDEFWDAVTDVLYDSPGAETIDVRGESGLLTGSDGEFRVDWLDRGGTVAMRIDLCCEMTLVEAKEIIDHLVEVDVATWRSLTGTDPTGTDPDSRFATSLECPSGFSVTDEDADGTPDTCRWARDGGACLERDMDGDGEADDCVSVDDP